MSVTNHKKNTLKNIKMGIVTISSTRTMENDKSGAWLSKYIEKQGHTLQAYLIVPDDKDVIISTMNSLIEEQKIQLIIFSGGTGISPYDLTIESVKPFFEKELTSFSSIFAMLSFEQIDSAAILSRATAGIIKKTVVFCLPGSLNAVKLACKNLIFPESGHILKHIYEGLQ